MSTVHHRRVLVGEGINVEELRICESELNRPGVGVLG